MFSSTLFFKIIKIVVHEILAQIYWVTLKIRHYYQLHRLHRSWLFVEYVAAKKTISHRVYKLLGLCCLSVVVIDITKSLTFGRQFFSFAPANSAAVAGEGCSTT